MASTTVDCWTRAELALTHCSRVFLSGPPGVGKTYAALRYALAGRNVYSATMTPESPSAESRGSYMPKGGEFAWMDGPFTTAMREGARLIVNEVSNASEDVLAFLYGVLESDETARITLPTGETVTSAPGFQVVVTDNQPLELLPEAIRSRLATQVHIPLPHPAAMERIRESYRDIALRSFQLPDHDTRRTTLRHWLNVEALLAKDVGEEVAFALTFGVEHGQMLREAAVMARNAS